MAGLRNESDDAQARTNVSTRAPRAKVGDGHNL
jgi:hypothetical protein